MFDRILKRLREKVRHREYVMTFHARREMIKDNLSIYDVECVLLNGIILERQKDQHTGEWKYRLRGGTLHDARAEIVIKISPLGKLVIITVYLV